MDYILFIPILLNIIVTVTKKNSYFGILKYLSFWIFNKENFYKRENIIVHSYFLVIYIFSLICYLHITKFAIIFSLAVFFIIFPLGIFINIFLKYMINIFYIFESIFNNNYEKENKVVNFNLYFLTEIIISYLLTFIL